MSTQKLKATIVQLERKRYKRRLAIRRLQEEHEQLLLESKAMDLLVQHQDTVARMLHRHFQPSSSPPPSIADDTGFIQPVMCEWPLMAEFQTMQLADYNWLLGTTAQQVRACCVQHLQQIAMAMNRRNASSSSSQQQQQQQQQIQQQLQADLDRAVVGLLFLLKAIYILTPDIANQIKDVNLITGQLEPPPSSHWERAFCATQASLEQLAVLEQTLQQVVPSLEQLETEWLELAACINSIKALTLKEQSAHAKAATQQLLRQQREEEQQRRQQQRQQQQGRVGASRAAGRRKAAMEQVAAVTAAVAAVDKVTGKDDDMVAEELVWQPRCAAAPSNGKQQQPAASNGYYSSLLQQAMDANSPAASPQEAAAAAAAVNGTAGTSGTSQPASNSNSDSTGAGSISASSLQYMRGTCKDMVADMDSRLLTWRTLSGARSAVTFVFQPEQLAAMVLAAFPYLPMMGNMCDYVPAARAAAVQREKQQQQQ